VKLIKHLRNAALATMLFSAGVANAALYQFQLTGDYTASWQLNSTVSPDAVGEGEGFVLEDVFGDFPGSFFDYTDLTFFSEAIGGGMQIEDYYGDSVLLSTDGVQLYTGSEFSPTFRLGKFALSEYLGTGRYSLTITDLDAVPPPVDVPEPASTALLLGGLGVLLASRKRRQAR
jgi:hypothetical protein